MQSNRTEDIREMIHFYVDVLLDLHDKTDPKYGKKSEAGKLERARKAIEVWWYAYDRLLLWAQSHIVGYSMLKGDGQIVEKFEKLFKKELTEDSHELEFMDPRRLYESPFTDLDDQGVSGLFPQIDVQKIVQVLNSVRDKAAA